MTSWFEMACAAAASAGFDKLMKDLTPLFLYYRRGGLVFAPDVPGPGWELGHAEAHRGSRTREQMVAWTREHAKRLPLLPPDDKTIHLAGRDYDVEVGDRLVRGRAVYVLSGKRGGRYVTLRNDPNPDLMFLADGRGHAALRLEDVWLTDRAGKLEQVR